MLIGIDFDGTLARHLDAPYQGPDQSLYELGEPIPSMVTLVKDLINQGHDVWIFTARAWTWQPEEKREKVIKQLEEWTLKFIGKKLPITSEKNPNMEWFLDDRAVAVKRNTGEILSPIPLTNYKKYDILNKTP